MERRVGKGIEGGVGEIVLAALKTASTSHTQTPNQGSVVPYRLNEVVLGVATMLAKCGSGGGI